MVQFTNITSRHQYYGQSYLICQFISCARIFRLHGDVIVSSKDCIFLSLCLAPMAFKLGGILIVLQVLWHEKKAIVVIQTKGTKDLSRWICIHHLHFNTRTIHSFLFILAYIFVFHFGMLEC